MRTKSLILIFIMAIIFLNTVPLKADLIVDTSAGLTTGGGPKGICLDESQWLAEKIFLPQAYTITQVQGIMGAFSYDGDISAAIRSDNGTIPGNILFSQIFTSSTPGMKTWQGPSNLSWTLSAGTYWLAFEVATSSTFNGVMESNPTMAGIGPDPIMPDLLHFYGSAATRGIGSSYVENGLFNIAIKVYGDLCPGDNPIIDPPPPYIPHRPIFTPLPSAIILIGTGLGCLVIYRRRKVNG